MNEELDKKLCEKYPKIFRNRHGDPTQTAMCWGFECGDGWYNILDILCGNIQWHIDQTRNQKAEALRYNRAMRKVMKTGDNTALVNYYNKLYTKEYAIEQAEKDVAGKAYKFKAVIDECPQVVAIQVKEKFGTLRFYFEPNGVSMDIWPIIDGISTACVQRAEYRSSMTCEVCGNEQFARSKEKWDTSVKLTFRGSWMKTLCSTCAKGKGYQAVEESEDV